MARGETPKLTPVAGTRGGAAHPTTAEAMAGKLTMRSRAEAAI
jgi:hypothetical protein